MTEEEKQCIRDRWIAGADNLALKYPEEEYGDLRAAAEKQAEDEIAAKELWRDLWGFRESSAGGSDEKLTFAQLDEALRTMMGDF